MGQRIDVNHENIYYGDFLAVEDVNIDVEPNKVTSFIGPSGCGKSTVLRTLDRLRGGSSLALTSKGERAARRQEPVRARTWIRWPCAATSAWSSSDRTRSRPCPSVRTCWPVCA